jgi:hypothetical protein
VPDLFISSDTKLARIDSQTSALGLGKRNANRISESHSSQKSAGENTTKRLQKASGNDQESLREFVLSPNSYKKRAFTTKRTEFTEVFLRVLCGKKPLRNSLA